IIFLICLSIGFYTILKNSEHRHTVINSMIITFILFIVLTVFVYIKPEWVNLNWGSTLVAALVILILSYLIPRLFGFKEKSGYYKILSIFSIFLFIIFVLYDTKLLLQKSKDCIFPNYPK